MTEQITSLTTGLMHTEVIKERFGEIHGRIEITLTLRAEVDPDDMQRQLAARRLDQGVRRQVIEREQRLAWLEKELRATPIKKLTLGGNDRRGSEQQEKDSVVLDVAMIRAEASKGNPLAQSGLGLMYLLGQEVPRSDSLAFT